MSPLTADPSSHLRHAALGPGCDLAWTADTAGWHGIQGVRIDGVELHGPSVPMRPWIRSPDGTEVVALMVMAEETRSDGVRWRFAPRVRRGGTQDWMLHEVRPRLATAAWADEAEALADASLELELRGCSREVGGHRARGLRYHYRWRSDSTPIYRLLDRACWQPGGSSVGCELWLRQGPRPRVRIADRAQPYSTEWYLRGIANPNIFQFKPLQTAMEGFTFTATEAGVLVTWATELAHIRTLVEKPYDRDQLLHWHEHCGDLAGDFATSPVEVLWFPGVTAEHERISLYLAMLDLVSAELHARLDMPRERVRPYGLIEQWDRADLERYRTQGLPALLAAGMKQIGLANHFENHMNVYGISNMCCTLAYEVAQSVGGSEALGRFCADARAGGAKVDMWGNTAISTIHPLIYDDAGAGDEDHALRFTPASRRMAAALQDIPDLFVRNPAGAIEADHYAPRFACFNLRNERYRRYWMERWTALQREAGIEGVFLDSSFNLSSDKFHWRPESGGSTGGGATIDQTHLLGALRPRRMAPASIQSQYRAFLELMAEMGRAGFTYLAEDVGLFGIHRSGPGAADRADNLWMWADGLATYDADALESAGHDPEVVFFQALAYRMLWTVCWNPNLGRLCFHSPSGPLRSERDLVGAEHVALYHAFNAVEPWMHAPEALPEGRGVRYRHRGREVLWSFVEQRIGLPADTPVRDVLAAEDLTGPLQAGRHRVYLIGA